MTERAGLLSADSEGTARKTAARHLATQLLLILARQPYGVRSDLARRLDVRPSAITQALNPDKYDTSLPLLERIAQELGYEAVITYRVEAKVRLRRPKPTAEQIKSSARRVADVMEGAFGG